jgi:hypothetical protein
MTNDRRRQRPRPLTVGEKRSRRRSNQAVQGRRPSEPYSPRSSWQVNLGLVIGLASVTFIAGRLLGIAAGDPETAYAILQAEGTGPVIVGSLIPMVGLMAAPVAIFASYYSISLGLKGPDHYMVAIFATVGSLATVIVFFTTPAQDLLLSCSVALIGIVFFRIAMALVVKFRPHHRKDVYHAQEQSHPLRAFIVIYTLFVLGVSTLSSTPWLPEQNIGIKGHDDFSGYILSEASGTTFILTHNPTGVSREASSDILFVKLCRASNYLVQQGTLNQWLGSFMSADRITSYPHCLPGSLADTGVRHQRARSTTAPRGR